MTSVLESIARLCRGTPTLEIRDNRGQPVRMLQYNRTPGNGMVLDERVTRQTANALGQTDSQIDPRLFSAGSTRPNFRYDLSLSGQTLSSASVDAGERYQLMDIEGRPCWSLDSRGNQRQFHYDRLGRPSAVIEQESGSAERVGQYWQYGEDTAASSPGCNLRGQIVAHYDTAGVQRTTAYGLQGQPLVTTRQLLRTAEQASDWALSQQSQWAQQLSTPIYTTEWRHDALGAVCEQQDAQGNVQRFRYNVVGQLASCSLQRASESEPMPLRELDYTAAGQKRREKTGNNVVTDYQYEAQTQRLQRVTTRRPSGNGAPQLQDLVYAYDPVGNILSVTDESKDVRYFANQAVAVESRYEYDALYQLVSATGRESVGGQDLGGQPPVWRPFPNDPSQLVNYEERYVYDRGGNLTDLHHRGAGNYHRHMTVGEGSNRAQLGYEGGDVETGFDACGNLRRLSPGGQRLQWDGRNQLREVVLVERTENASDREVYQYGGDGMRVRKERSRLASGVNGREEVIYLPGLELRTRYAGEEAREAWAVIVSDTARVLHWEKGKPDGLANDSIRYSLDNHLGSSVMELDGDGKLITAEEYYPYGGTACWLAKSEVEAKYKTVRYSGKERDETGLYDYGYRYYAPWLGRWLNPDPAGTVDGINIFCFVCGNPTSAYDLDGDILYHFVDSRDIDLDRQDPRGAGYNPQQQRRHAKVAVNFEFPTLKAGGSVDFYLKRTRPGNLFTGIVDVDSGEVNLHPLNINRIGEGGPSQNDGWKKNYAGEFYEGHGALIEHNPSAGLGMTSHEQAAKIFKKNKFTSIGFSFYDVRGLRSMGDSLGREESKNTSALYGRSRSLNRPHMYRVPDSMKPGGSNIESFRAAEREYNPTKLKGDIEKGREVVEPFFELPIEFKVKILDLLRGCVEDSHLSRVLRDEMERPEYLIETYGKLKNKKNNTVVHNPAYANFRF